MAKTAATSGIPERLGDFEIDGVLGEGGSAVVYSARRPAADPGLPDDELALKVLRPELSLSDRETSAFLEEAHRAQRVSHPSLVAIRDAGLLPDGRPFLSMPRLNGECLAARLARGPLGLDAALALFRGLTDAVGALHEAGLVHRDIKPENIFLVGKEEHLVLLDLGIARDVDAPASTTTQAGLVRGTPAYMAPERFFGARASPLTDTYELAVTLYVMLTGRLPWDVQDARGRMSPKDPRKLVALPDLVAETLLRALSVDETVRPPNARALHQELEQAAISGADTGLLAVTPPPSGAPSPSGGALDRSPDAAPLGPARAVSVRPPDGTTLPSAAQRGPGLGGALATQDTVALSTRRGRRRGPSWAAAMLSACILASAAAGAYAFLVRPAGVGAPAAPSTALAAPAPTAGDSPSPRPEASTDSPPPPPSASADSPSPPPSTSPDASASGSGAPHGSAAAPQSVAGSPAVPSTAAARPAPRPTAAASGKKAEERPGGLGSAVPNCLTLISYVCAPHFTAIDKGLQCAQTRTLLQLAGSQPPSQQAVINSTCQTSMLAAMRLFADQKR